MGKGPGDRRPLTHKRRVNGTLPPPTLFFQIPAVHVYVLMPKDASCGDWVGSVTRMKQG